MLASSVAVRSLALLMLGFGSASALAQSASVSAFNPYNGIGLPGSPAPMAPQASGVYASPPQPGMAFNPWRPGGVAAVWGSAPPTPPAYATYQGSSADAYQDGGYGRGSYLPAPPPGPIESRIVAIPERGSRDNARRPPTSITPAQPAPMPAPAVAAPAPPPPPPPAMATATPPPQPAAPEPVPVRRTPNSSTASTAPPPSPPTSVAPTPAPVTPPTASTPPSTEAAAPPPPPSGPRQAPASGPSLASVNFARDSAEITGEARGELDRVAKTLNTMKQVEVRAYATGPDPADARKVALARALAVRSYLIDQGVKIRIEVGAFASEARGTGSDRVDVVTPGG